MNEADGKTTATLLDIGRNLHMRSRNNHALRCLRAMIDIELSSDDAKPSTTIASLSEITGIHMVVKPGDFISDEILRSGCWEPEVTREILAISSSTGGLMVDVGANMGYFSLLWAGSNPGNRVFSIEPVFRNIDMIRKNIEMNGLNDRITVMPVAASNRRGMSSFDEGSAAETGHGGLTKAPSPDSTKITTIMLDDYFDEIDVLKIDVEGADALVLMGASKLLMDQRIGTVLYEINENRCALLGLPPASASELLRAYGYQVDMLVDYGPGGSEWIARRRT